MAAGHSVWSQLPHHLLGLVFHHLSYPDLIRSHAVCKSWFLALKSINKPIKTHSPMLLLAGDEIDDESEFRTLFCLAGKKSYRLHLPQIRGRQILASADGWLITIDDAAELHLFNPFTHAEHALPSITTLSVIEGAVRDSITGRITGYMYDAMPRDEEFSFHDLEFMLRWFYHRGVIFYQSSSSEIVVFIIYSDYQDLAFARLGDECWTELEKISPPYFFMDVILHKGRYYGASIGGFCIAFDISRGSFPKAIFVGPTNHEGTFGRYYLAESSDGDHLMQIWRHEDWVSPEGEHAGVPAVSGKVFKTQNFTLFSLDMIKNKMIKVERLEQGTALFLGDNRSMILRTQDLPELKENCIYFTDGDIEYLWYRHMRRDVGVFNMKTGNVEPLYPSDSILNLLTWPPPVWLTIRQS